MTEQASVSIKEARTAGGMTQKALADAVDGVSAKDISAAERGLKELTDEQMGAIAEATGVDPELLVATKDEPMADPAQFAEVAAPNMDDEDILELFDAADPAAKAAALSVLKGDTPQSKGILDSLMPMLAGIMGDTLGGDMGGNPLVAIIGFLASEDGKAFMGTIKGVLDNFTGVFGEIGARSEENQEPRRTYNSILAFTFFYTVAIYVLLIGFYYWQGRLDLTLGEGITLS